MARGVALLATLLVAGCAAAGADWTKPGADADETARILLECVALAGTATQTDADIDQDIAATRASDLQHSGGLREQAQQRRNDDRDRAAAIVQSCMQAKGFTRNAR